jgi:hypothetical protein
MKALQRNDYVIGVAAAELFLVFHLVMVVLQLI